MTTATKTPRGAAELDWWQRYLDHPTAKQRMWALYGARYMDFFGWEFENAGSCLEIGSGPLPVMEIMECKSMLAADPLAAEYRQLTGWPILDDVDSLTTTGRWETVLLLNVLDHAEDPQKLVEQAHRYVRPGGRVLVYVQLHEGDERHSAVTKEQARGWIVDAGLSIGREAVLRRSFDPPAWAAVCHKVALPDTDLVSMTAEALDEAGASWWLSCGAALGYHRHGGPIPWDHDIDIGIDAKQADPQRIKEALEARGFDCWRRLGTPGDGYVMQFQHPLIYRLLDLYWHYEDGDKVWMAVYSTKGRRRYVYDAALLRLEAGDFLGTTARVPGVPYLEAHYGPDWRTPKETWDWSQDPLCLE